MNLKKSKIFTFLICFVCLILTGCGYVKEIETDPVHEEEIANLDELLRENGVESFEVKAVVEREATAFVLMETWDDDSQGQMIYQVKEQKVSPIVNLEISEDTVTKAMDIDMKGNIYILEEKRENEDVLTQVKCLEKEKDRVREFSLDKYVGENDSVQSIQLDGEGDLFLFFESGKMDVLCDDFRQVKEIKDHEGEYYIDAARLQDGSIVFVFAKYKGDQEVLSLCEVDKALGTTNEILKLPEARYGNDLLFCGKGMYDYYINEEEKIYGGSRTKPNLMPVARLQDADIMLQEVKYICSVSEDKMFAVKESESVELIYFSRGEKKSEEEKEILYMASLNCDNVIEKEVVEFNKKNNDYRIELKKYGEEENPVNSFLVDVATGEEFDMVEILPEEAEKLMTKEIFIDLYPFIDADPTLSREAFYDNMLKAFEYNGKLYQSVSFVHLYGWVTKKSRVNESEKWNFKSIRNYIEQNPEIHIFTDTSGEEILNQMVFVSSDELLDWEQKTCHFETKTFEDILKFAKKYGTNREQILLEDKVPALVEDRLLFVETPIAVEELYMYTKVLGEDVTVVTSPFSKQIGANLYSTMPQVGIVSKSSKQEGAWQFVRRFFTKEYQDISGDREFLEVNYSGFPIRKDCIDGLIKRFTATEDYEKDGRWISCIKAGDYSISWDGYEIEVGPMEKVQEDLLRELLINASRKQEIDPTIQKIILEESRAYFSGEKEADQVAGIIQNRVLTYMNE